MEQRGARAVRTRRRIEREDPDRCPRCEGTFGCGIASGTCWCASVALTPERQAELAAGYEGCLCPACLTELQAAR